MNRHLKVAIFAGLISALALVLWIDPRVPSLRSEYTPSASPAQIRAWMDDLKAWPESPTWERFKNPDPLNPPDFERTYLFGKFKYPVQIQIRGDRMQYISWGADEQDIGGAWYALGEGKRLPSGEWRTIWSCLDISRGVSNGGGAWIRFNRDRSRIHVEYHHDTLPFGERPIEEGEGVTQHVIDHELPKGYPLEGRVRTQYPTLTGEFHIWGRVVDEQGQGVVAAAVKRRASGRVDTVTDARGFFKLSLDKLEALTLISAGKVGYQNATVILRQAEAFRVNHPTKQADKIALVTLELPKLDPVDHRDYQWVSSRRLVSPQTLRKSPRMLKPDERYSPAKHLNCGNCHTRHYDQWKVSRHAGSATNPWVRVAFENDFKPWALENDRPEDTCTPCHSPSLASKLHSFHVNGTTLLDAKGVDREGNHCDFCHKIASVQQPQLNGVNGSLQLLRPDPHDDTNPGNVKRVFGPLADVSFLYMGASYNPMFKMGTLCASCHENTPDHGPVVASTYTEWQQTKYARAGDDYQECQSCHMPPWRKGKIEAYTTNDGERKHRFIGGKKDLSIKEARNDGAAIADYATRYRPLNETSQHRFYDSEDTQFVRDAVKLTASRNGDKITVRVENTAAGHAVPTGHGLKRYLVILTAKGQPAIGLPESERYGLGADAFAGAIIGRQFDGDWTVPFWRAKGVTLDTRLWPDKPQEWAFDAPTGVKVTVSLVLRRGSPELLNQHDFKPESNRAGKAIRDRVIQRLVR